MAEMPEIGTLSNKTISKLAGVAPLAQDSGKHQGKRAVRGGRAAVREILFIVASVVGRHEPDFVAFQNGFAMPASRQRSSGSLWLTSCWCGSMPKPEKSDNGWQFSIRPRRPCSPHTDHNR